MHYEGKWKVSLKSFPVECTNLPLLTILDITHQHQVLSYQCFAYGSPNGQDAIRAFGSLLHLLGWLSFSICELQLGKMEASV